MSVPRRAIAIVDGEHYPPVVRAALEEVDDLVVAAVLIGGTEKLRDDVDGYGVPLEPTVEEAVANHRPDVVLDLSDEPVLGPVERLALVSRVLALGAPYEGPDFRFAPPVLEPVDVPFPSWPLMFRPKTNTSPTSRRIAVWFSPTDPSMALVEVEKYAPPESISVAVAVLLVEPVPRRPFWPEPAAYTWPLLVIAKLLPVPRMNVRTPKLPNLAV